jgi:signal peptidase I
MASSVEPLPGAGGPDQDDAAEERHGPLRRAVGWLFQPAAREEPAVDTEPEEESFTSWLDTVRPAPDVPFAQSEPRTHAPISVAETEPELQPAPEAAAELPAEPQPAAEPELPAPPAPEPQPELATAETTVIPAVEAEVEPEPGAAQAEAIAPQQPGSDLSRRLAAANAAAIARARMAPPEIDEADEETDDEGEAQSPPRRRVPLVSGRAFESADTDRATSTDETPPDSRNRRSAKVIVRLVVAVALAITAVVLLRTYIVAPYYIPSGSMEPTLHGCSGCNNDHVLVDKLSYRSHDVHRGDVVVFHRPTGWSVSEKILIKRVIGLPGDELTTRKGVVYVNGLALDEPYLNRACRGGTKSSDGRELKTTVPDNDVFVMGDNRCDSADSRSFGPVPESKFIGRAFVIIWPFGRIHWL